MKILQLVFSLGSGGAERLIVDLCNELAHNNEVTLCTILTEDESENVFYKPELSTKIKWMNLGCKKGVNMKTFLTVIKLIRKSNPDVIHGHLNVLYYMYLPSIFLRRKKFFHTIHSLSEKYVVNNLHRCINRFFYKNFIQAITISDECTKSYEQVYKLSNSIQIKNGRSEPSKTIDFENVRVEIESLKKNQDDHIFLHVARFAEAKNQSLLIESFNNLLNDGIHLILIVIGHGFEDGDGLTLKNKARDGIYFLGKRQNIADYLINSDFFCLTSKWEGMPISLLEALACGVMPICTPVGGIPELIKDSTYGILSESLEIESYMNAVKKAIGKLPQYDKNFVQSYFKNNYSMEKCALNYIDIFKKL